MLVGRFTKHLTDLLCYNGFVYVNSSHLTLLVSSGIGLYASKLLHYSNPKHRLLLVARSSEKAEVAKREVQAVRSTPENNQNIIPLSCDHSSLESVKKFAQVLKNTMAQMNSSTESHCGDPTSNTGLIDVVCFNAAMITSADSKPQFTQDDIEITFQTNHIAPFLMMNLIHDLIAPGGRVIITSSGLHEGPLFHDFSGCQIDPLSGTVEPHFDTLNGIDFHYKQTYALSKLCNTAFCLALHRRLQQRQNRIIANCFTPGLITTTGLWRHQNKWLMPFFSLFANAVMNFGSTVEWGGGALAWMAISDQAGKEGGQYYKTPTGSSHNFPMYGESFCVSPMSAEATNEENQDKLWDLSAQLAGISKDLL